MDKYFFSEEVEVLSKVPQGSILGPTLFNIYINDTPTTVKNKISLYADDPKLIGLSIHMIREPLCRVTCGYFPIGRLCGA